MKFLGFVVNSTTMELKLPGEKMKKIKSETDKALSLLPTVYTLLYLVYYIQSM